MTLSAEDFPAIARVTAGLRQGDLISTTHFPILETPASTFDPLVEHLAPFDGQDVWAAPVRPIRSGWGVIVTQTCDIVRDPDTEPYLQVVPLVELADEDAWRGALHGRSGSYFALPRHEQACANPGMDAQVCFAVPKAALLHPGVRTLPLSFDPAGRIYLSTWMARRFARHPFPDPVEETVLKPLRKALVDRHKKPNTQPGAFVHSLLGVWCTPEEAPVLDLVFVMSGAALAANRQALPDEKALEAQPGVLLKPIAKRLQDSGSGIQLRPSVRTLDSVSAEQLFLSCRQVDLDLLPYDAFIADDSADRQLVVESS